MAARGSEGRLARYGWIFAAIWLFYLVANVRALLARRTGVAAAQRELDAATAALSDGAHSSPGADEAYAVALERWLGLGAADLDERAAAVTTELGLDVELDRRVTALSGGQAARAGLASLLLSRYDVLLLDEPTNDLDLPGLAMLEDFVLAGRAGTVLVSHDRRFLERTVDRVLELDLAQHQVHLYGGGYAAYLAERETLRRHSRAEYEEYAGTRSAWPGTVTPSRRPSAVPRMNGSAA